MKYDNTKSLTENAMAGVDITIPEEDGEMNKTILADLIYDKLMNNTSNKQFEPEMAEEAEIVYDINSGEAEYISITINGKEYYLTIKENNNVK